MKNTFYWVLFLEKIELIKENLDKFQVPEPWLVPVTPKENLESFSQLSSEELCNIVQQCLSAPCLLDPIPTSLDE